jgi:general secretion pathway protein F
MKFSATTLDSSGQLSQCTLEAASDADARRQLASRGLRVVSLASRGLSLNRGGVNRAQQLQLCAAVEQVLNAGLTLTEALAAIRSDQEGVGSQLAEELLVGLQRGLTPSAAFSATQSQWSPLLIALLRSGERSGTLPASFKSYVAFETGMAELRSRLVSASVYPVVLLVASLLVLGFLLGFVVPKFAIALEDVRADLPAASTAILQAGLWLNAHWGKLLAAIAIAALAVGVALSRGDVRTRIVGRLLTLPAVRPVAEAMARAQAFRIVSALILGGEPLVRALEVAIGSARGLIRSQLESCARFVSQGMRPSSAFHSAGLTGALGQQMLIAAERSATLGECLHQLALQQETRTSRTLDRMTTVYGPVLLLGIAVLVAAVVVALYWPLLQLFESVK